VPLHLRIVEPLLRRIQSGELTPGHRLPTEALLRREHGVSRATARRALDELAERGLVRPEAGRGTFVATPSIAVDLPHLLGLTAAIVASVELGAGRNRVRTDFLRRQSTPAEGMVGGMNGAHGRAREQMKVGFYLPGGGGA